MSHRLEILKCQIKILKAVKYLDIQLLMLCLKRRRELISLKDPSKTFSIP